MSNDKTHDTLKAGEADQPLEDYTLQDPEHITMEVTNTAGCFLSSPRQAVLENVELTISRSDAAQASEITAALAQGEDASASGVTLTIEGGEYTSVTGARAEAASGTAKACGNRIVIRGGKVGTVIGGCAASASGSASASGNVLVIQGGTASSQPSAGASPAMHPQLSVKNGELTLRHIKNAVMGALPQVHKITGEFFRQHALVAALPQVHKITFILPPMRAGDCVLTVTSAQPTDISGAEIQVQAGSLLAGSCLGTGERIILVRSEHGLAADACAARLLDEKGNELHGYAVGCDAASLYLTRL